MKSIAQLLDTIEGVGFECEGGPLKNLREWTELKRRIANFQRIEQRAQTAMVASTDVVDLLHDAMAL